MTASLLLARAANSAETAITGTSTGKEPAALVGAAASAPAAGHGGRGGGRTGTAAAPQDREVTHMADPRLVAPTLVKALIADGLPATWDGSAKVALITTATAHMWVYPTILVWPGPSGRQRHVVLDPARWEQIVIDAVRMFRTAADRVALTTAVDDLLTALHRAQIRAMVNINADSGVAAIYARADQDNRHHDDIAITVSARDYRWRAPDGHEHRVLRSRDEAVAHATDLIARQLRGDR